MEKAIQVYIAKAVKKFKQENPNVYATILVALMAIGGALESIKGSETLGEYTDIIAMAGQGVSFIIVALNGSDTYEYLPKPEIKENENTVK